jgi:hypothetical protein
MENDNEKGSDVQKETASNSNASKLEHPNGNLEDQDDSNLLLESSWLAG